MAKSKGSSAKSSAPTEKKADTRAGGKADANNPPPKGAPATAANTPATHYLSRLTGNQCDKEKDTIRTKCADDKKKDSHDAFDKAKPGSGASKVGAVVDKVKQGVAGLDTAAKDLYGYKPNANNGWIDSHCKGLWVKPAGVNTDQFMKSVNDAKGLLEKDLHSMLQKAGGQIVDKAGTAVKDYAIRAGEKEAASLASLAFPVAGEVIVAGVSIFNIVDGVWTTGKTVYDVGGKAYEALKQIGPLRDQLGKLSDVISKKISPTELWADIMSGVAYTNPCVTAKRCELVPFNQTRAAQQAHSGKGCCPGQTGHHLLPSEMFQDCAAYTAEKERNAPTVCVEGVNNTHGSHGVVHGAMDKLMTAHRKNTGKDEISNNDAIDKAVESHRLAFGPHCSEACLKAQLHSYYDNLCNGKLKPRGGKGTDIEEGSTDSTKAR